MDRISFKGEAIEQIDLAGVPHSGFDRSNHNYGSGKLGAIIPTRFDETYPGDRVKGSPIMVSNFEPLAAPLMGSMVQKQEAFFVPLPQVWKNAYKFFTGKNGYDGKVPSISPAEIFEMFTADLGMDVLFDVGRGNFSDVEGTPDHLVNVLSELITGPNDENYFSDLEGSHKDLNEYMEPFLGVLYTFLNTTYGSRKMLDLVLPIYRHWQNFAKSDYVREMSNKFEKEEDANSTRKKAVLEFAARVGDLLQETFLWFFGASSLFDYMGWPVMLKKFYAVRSLPGANSSNVFASTLESNVTTYGSATSLLIFLSSKFSNVPLNFLPFKAYYLTWYWNYRDQLLETDILDPDEDEFLSDTLTTNVIVYCTMLRQRCWFKDAFTTALTNTGDGNLLVPTLAGVTEDVTLHYFDDNGQLLNTTDSYAAFAAGATVAEVSMGDYSYKIPMNYLSPTFSESDSADTSGNFISLDLFDRIKRLRSFIQKKLVLGYEVDDVIWSSFLVRLSNTRMHIPELLSRGRDAVEISTLVNNTTTDMQIAGDKTATAWCKGKASEVNYFCEEWGFFIQLATVMPIQTYAGGMQRIYLKRDVFDYMWPEFATMGMDAVYNCELAALGTRLSDEKGLQVFGYQGRYYDLKYRQDEEHGRLLEDLNYLTFSREFDEENLPKLNYIFVHCWPRLDGFVVESPLVDVFRYDCYTAQGWERRLPVPSSFIH